MLRTALLLIAMSGLASAQAPVSLQLVDTDPPAGSRLKPGQGFYARVQYQTDREIHIWGRGVGTERTPGNSHPSPVYGPGSGQALVWFALNVPGTVEVMRIQAVARGSQAAVAQLEHPVKLRWEHNAPNLPRAAWVEPMALDLQQRIREPVAPAGLGWDVFTALVFACTPAYLVLQAFAFWRMRGRYGFAFWLPAGVMALVYLAVLLAALAGSNLAPIWIVFASPFALAYVIVLLTLDFRRTSSDFRRNVR